MKTTVFEEISKDYSLNEKGCLEEQDGKIWKLYSLTRNGVIAESKRFSSLIYEDLASKEVDEIVSVISSLLVNSKLCDNRKFYIEKELRGVMSINDLILPRNDKSFIEDSLRELLREFSDEVPSFRIEAEVYSVQAWQYGEKKEFQVLRIFFFEYTSLGGKWVRTFTPRPFIWLKKGNNRILTTYKEKFKMNETEFEEKLKKAKQGDAEAQHELGFQYHYGLEVEQDSYEAAKWYKLAADQGHANTQYSLGLMLEFGVKQDYEKAVKWYKLAAEQGHADAQVKLDLIKTEMHFSK